MLLPGADHAVVEPRKLRDYLLATSHSVGRFKASFFASLGFTQDAWGVLAAGLRKHAAVGSVRASETTRFGQKYEVAGQLRGPNGKDAEVVAVWIILNGEEVPRFVTRVPGRTTMTFNLHDTVVLNRDLPDHGLRKGDLGAVVEVYEPDGLEVEFVTGSGRTQAVLTLSTDDVRPVQDRDLMAVRPLDEAK